MHARRNGRRAAPSFPTRRRPHEALLTRIAELQGMEAITVLAADSAPPAGFDEDLSALGIHPPAVLASCAAARGVLGGPAHVHVARIAAGSGDGEGGVLIGVGPVEDLTQWAAGGDRGDLLALRLALLSCPYRDPAKLTRAVLADAAGSVAQWRRGVAEWAGEPSRPIPAEAASVIRVRLRRGPRHRRGPGPAAQRGVPSGRPGGREVRDIPVRRPCARLGAPP